MKKPLFFILFISLFHLHYGQRPVGSQSITELEAFEGFQERKFYQVKEELGSKKQLTTNEQLILALSELKVGNQNTDALLSWLRTNKNHPLYSLALFNYAQFLFYQGSLNESKPYLSKVRSSELTDENKVEYAFMTGIIAIEAEQYELANKRLDYAKANGFQEEDQLAYYQAFVDYHLNDLDGAVSGFTQSANVADYANSSRYFLALIYLEKGEYAKVTDLARDELSDEKTDINSGFYQLLGEAYAMKDEVEKADAYFEKALEYHPGNPSSALYYQAGVSKFKIGNTEKALKYLTQSGLGTGPYAKLSAFQLGRLHIQRNEPEAALSAYIEASSSEDPSIREESYYQSAKLNARLGRYSEAIDYGSDYLKEFTDGRWKEELQNLIALSYLKTSNYDQALAQLEQDGILNRTQEEVYQKVAFQKGILSFNDGEFHTASTYFTKSLRFPIDQELVNDAYFHLGEGYLRDEDYVRALESYRQISPRSPEASYGMGYALFNQQKYDAAIPYFTTATRLEDPERRDDANLRLAGSLYATKAYSKAIKIYDKLPPNDYVRFQKGLIYRNLDQNENAIRSFNLISSNSSYKDDALFYTAQISFENSSFERAEREFSSVINRFNQSNYLPKAYLNRGISRNNLGKYESAKEDYEFVIKNFLQKDEAFSAILGLQDLQQKDISIPNLESYISDYKQANPNDGSLEVVEFEAAKGTYFDLDYVQAITKISSFLEDYPLSRYRTEAVYYLGDAYYRSGKLQEARTTFDDQRFVRNAYTGRVLFRLGNINVELEDYDRAMEDYQLLLELNLSPKDDYQARNGLMTASFQNGRYSEAIRHADQIIDSDWKPLNAESIARMTKAKSLMETNQKTEARSLLEVLSKGEDQFAVEASYLLAFHAHMDGQYDASLELLFDLTSRFGSYASWIEQSYLLIAENYIAKDELFQAKATLRSIIQHSQDEATIEVATQKLSQIEQVNIVDTLTNENK